MAKPHDWATCTVHDERIEHWRVTALLAKDAHSLWQAVWAERVANPPEIEEDEIQLKMRILRQRLELTDYFMSGLGEK